ncbi:ankyrin repeat domain-containing protein [uncultured Croceitalea sp.]|uniref:ankyrin repeat domain-containing protein n=1 Tax=uncultured Croceitalea sp. TaxID=1798908 RepID=UPI0033058E6D
MKADNLFISILMGLISIGALGQNMYRTACQGNLTRLDSLVRNTPIDTVDDRGRSLLHWAVACKQYEVVDFLLKKKIDVAIEDSEGRTPLYMTVRFANDSLFHKLVDQQPNSDWIAKHGAAMMEKAILNKDLSFVEKLIANGVTVDAKNNRGSTPLELAMRLKANDISAYLMANGADINGVRTIQAKGPYLGQDPPGNQPKMFAPNFISTEEYEFGSVFNKTMNKFYYGVDVNGKAEIRYTKLVGDIWSKPETLLPKEDNGYNDPFLSPDEDRLYFISNRKKEGETDDEDHDIWYVEKTANGWSLPINAGSNINSDRNEYYISFTDDGSMYFSTNKNAEEGAQNNYDIYRSKFVDGKFQEAQRLSDAINTSAYEADVFVAPDESYVIFCSTRADGLGRGDMYFSFKKPDGQWAKAVNMGSPINTEGHELCPFVTKDGNYLFYTSKEDIYWVSTAIFKNYKSSN